MYHTQQQPGHQGQGLPVPDDRPLSQNFVNSPPGYPQTQMTMSLPSEVVGPLHETLINVLQSGVQKSTVRIFMFNRASEHGFNNEIYATLLDAALELYFALQQQGVQGNILQMAAEDIVKAEIPMVVDKYPQLRAKMSQQQQHDLDTLWQLNEQVYRTIGQMGGGQPQQRPAGPQYGPAQAQPYGPQQYPQGPGYGGGGQMPGRPVAPGPVTMYQGGGNPMHHSGPPTGPGMQGPQMRPGAHHAPMRPTPAVHGPAQSQPTRSMLDNSNGQQPQQQPARATGANRAPVVSASAASTTQVFNKNEDNDAMKRVSPTDRELGHYSDVHAAVQSESHGRYAPAMDRPVEFVGKRYVPVRNSNQRIVASEADNEMTYSIIDVGNDMNYADHEENVNMVKLARDNQVGPKVGIPTDWAKVSVPNEVDASDEQVEFENDEPVALKEWIEAYTLDQARVEAQRKLIAKGLAENDQRVVECYAHLRTPILSNKEEHKILTEKLESIGNLTQLVDGLILLKKDISSTLWYEIHDRMTCIFNRRLAAGLGLYTWDVDSITEDYAEALEALTNEFKQVAIDRFKDNTYIAMRKALLPVFSDRTNIMHLADEVSITAVPWSSDDIDLVLEAKYAMLSAAANSHFFTAADRIFRRTNVKTLSVNRRYIVTADNVWIELHIGDLSTDTLLISKVDRC